MIYKLHTKNTETLVNMDECILMQYAPVQPWQSGVVLICFNLILQEVSHLFRR